MIQPLTLTGRWNPFLQPLISVWVGDCFNQGNIGHVMITMLMDRHGVPPLGLAHKRTGSCSTFGPLTVGEAASTEEAQAGHMRREMSSASLHCLSHSGPGNRERSSLASKVRRDQACSGWHGHSLK